MSENKVLIRNKKRALRTFAITFGVLFGLFVLGNLVFGGFPKVIPYNSDLNISGGQKTRIYYWEKLPSNWEGKIKIFSINSDGTEKKFEKEIELGSEYLEIKGLSDGMGGLEGDGKNPFGEGEIIATKRKIILKKNGNEKEIMSQKFPFLLQVQSVSWMPDSKNLIIVSRNKLGIFNIETLKYAFLTEGLNPSLEGPKTMFQDEFKKFQK